MKRLLRTTKTLVKGHSVFSSILKSIAQFDPQLVYVRVTDNFFPFLYFSEAICSHFDIPLVSHVMDDYEEMLKLENNSWDRGVRYQFFKRDIQDLFKQSELNLAISDRMCAEFERRYGVRFQAIHNGVDPIDWEFAFKNLHTPEFANSERVFTIILAGAIDAKKDAHVVTQVARVISELNLSAKLKCHLILNVPDHYFDVAKQLEREFPGVRAQKYEPLAQYRRLLSNADCLLLARNFDEMSKAFAGLSFHNKLPEYMFSGRPILCIGPDWDNSVEFLRKHKAAIVLGKSSDLEIREQILEIAEHPYEFQCIATRAREIAAKKMNIQEIRGRFEQLLIQAMRSKNKFAEFDGLASRM